MVVYGEKPRIVFNNVAKKTYLKTDDLVKMVKAIPYDKSPMTRINAALRLVNQKVFPSFYRKQHHTTKVCT